MNINSAIYNLYSNSNSVLQYNQVLRINKDIDPLYNHYRELYKDDSVYIEVPDINEIVIISNIKINNNSKYEIIADKNILGQLDTIIVKKYKKIIIRIYDINNYDSLKISFDVTLAKKSITSNL